MSSRRYQGHKPVTLSTREVSHVLGAVLLVDGVVVGDSLPLSSAQRDRLLQTLHIMAAHYEVGGLPPKLFYFRFKTQQLMVIFSRRAMLAVLLPADAPLADVEISSRKVVATAHLKGALDERNVITRALRTAATPHVPPLSTAIVTLTTDSLAIPSSHMTWTEASQSLENIIAKVLSQAQAAKLIATAIQRKGIDTTRPADAATVAEIGHELTQKVPSRPIRASLEREVAAMVATIR